MTNEELKRKFVFYNPWWQQKSVPSPLLPVFKRRVYSQIISYFSLKRIIVLKGPRRTGKSTLMYQLIDYFLKKGVKPERILYLNFEDPLLRVDFHLLLEVFEKISQELLDRGEQKYIFLDEVHLLPNWANSVKAFFDKKYPLKFICSGSASSLIQKSTESLAGRTIEEIIYPFSFREWADYQLLKSGHWQEINEKNYFLFEKEINLLFEKYLKRGGFAHLLEIEEIPLLHKLVYEDVIQKVIYKDLVDLFGIRDPMGLEKVFYYLINTSSQILNITRLSSTVGLNRETLRIYLSYLKRAFLYFELYKFSRSIKQTLSSSVKIHLIDPSFFLLASAVSPSCIWETVIVNFFYEKYPSNIFYWREVEEVDLVFQRGGRNIPVEIKSGENVDKKDIKGLQRFLERFKEKEGWVVYAGRDKEEKLADKVIKYFSAPRLLYLGVR